MKEKLICKRNNALPTFMFAVLAVSVIMLGFYFYKFNNGLSTNNEDWGGFGSYFASITGLLAFAGVLYTAWQSEQRANKAKEESIRREERDLFFKLLDLHLNQLKSITYKTKDKIYEGIEAVKQVVIKAEKLMLLYLVYEQILQNNQLDSSLITKLKQELKVSDSNTLNNIISRQIDNRYITSNSLKRNELRSQRIKNAYAEMNDHTKYQAYKLIADSLYKGFGFHYAHYTRNFFYILKTIENFQTNSDKEYYFQILKAQLSRYEITLLFYNAISSKSSNEIIRLMKTYNIFDEFYYKDLPYENENEINQFINKNLELWINNN